MRLGLTVGLACSLALAAGAVSPGHAAAAPPEPKGPHPRMLLDPPTKAAWRAALEANHGPLVGAVTLCEEAETRRDHDGALYMGAEWAKMLQACLVAWAATDKPAYAASAIKYFTALIDDLDKIGDGKGGDSAVSRDSGYPIRNLGPYTALAYDWLHDAPGMTDELRARARKRWAAWLGWYKDKGYHPRDPGANYHAGYLIAATMIAVAQAGEAGGDGSSLWQLVADELWGKDMAKALAPGGALDGGDWNEGWQYGPLSVAEYSLAERVARAAGIRVDGVAPWLASLLRRHVYALTPSDRLWAGGDFDSEKAYMDPQVMILDAIAIGDANPDDKKAAKGELVRLKLTDKDWLLYDALANIGEPAQLVPRSSWPTWYQAANTATLFTRTTWDEHAVWFVAACAQTDGLDHRGPNAGNFVFSRGAADLIVDPSPYGSLSTLTGNAPTVVSPQAPPLYVPSQLAWSRDIAWEWSTKTRGGIVAARCDYADAYRFQERKSDIAEALRDFVLLPSADGHDASLVIIDRADTGGPTRKMMLRFRVPTELAIDSAGTGTATIGDTKLTISSGTAAAGFATGAPPSVGKTQLKDCFQKGTTRGNCDAARFPVTDYRVDIPGPTPRAIHVIDATGTSGGAAHTPISGDGWTGIHTTSPRDAVVIWSTKQADKLTYHAPKGHAVSHIVLDAPANDGRAMVSAAVAASGDSCNVAVTPASGGSGSAGSASAGGSLPARPLIFTVDEHCSVTADPEQPNGVSAEHKPASLRSKPNGRHGGCCGAMNAPASPIATSAAVFGLLIIRRRRRSIDSH